MKIKEIHQRQRIKEESWADIAKAAYAGATGQKDLFGGDKPNQYNPAMAKSQEGADWLAKSFISKANSAKSATPENYSEIAKQLLNQLLINQTSKFQNILSTLSKKSPKFQTLLTKTGLAKPGTDIDTFIKGVKSSFGNVPEITTQLDKLGTTHNEILLKAAKHQPGQKIDPALQQDMAGFAAAWYNLPSTLQYAADRIIQSARYGERWIDAGNGIEIKPATAYDRTIQARYQDDLFYYDVNAGRWIDGARQPVSIEMAYSLNQALKTAGVKTQKQPSAAGPESDISKIVEPGMQYKFANPEDPTINIIIRNSGYYYDRLPTELRGGQVKRDRESGMYAVTRPDNIMKINQWYDRLADRGKVIQEPISAL